MRVLTFLFRFSKILFFSCVIAGIIAGAANALALTFIENAVSNPKLPAHWALHFALICMLIPAARITSQILNVKLSQAAMADLLLRLSKDVLALPLLEVEKSGSQRLIPTLTEDLSIVVTALSNVPAVLVEMTLVICCLAYLGWLSYARLFPVIAWAAIVSLVVGFTLQQSDRFMRQMRGDSEVIFSRLRAMTDGIKELQLHAKKRAAFLTEMLGSAIHSYRSNYSNAMLIVSASQGFGQLCFLVLLGGLVWSLTRSSHVITAVGTAYILVLTYLLGPIDYLLNIAPIFRKASVSTARIEKLGTFLQKSSHGLRTGPEEKACVCAPPTWKSIRFAGVTHTYGDFVAKRGKIFGPFDITVTPGEVVFLVGGNGSGKTTMLKLMTGLYTPGQGEILLDGQPITDSNRLKYREMFSAVFTDFVLFDRLLGIESETIEKHLEDYLQRLQLNNVISISNRRISTLAISQGQRKRMALLNAILEDRPIYVFDEWAADQDPEYKRYFYHDLLRHLKDQGKTIIASSHDEQYFDIADRIIELRSNEHVAWATVVSPCA